MEERRSANYEPSAWNDEYVQSLSSPFLAKEYLEQSEKLQTQVKIMIEKTEDEMNQLELIDNLRRLDICHHFKDQIIKTMNNIYLNNESQDHEMEKDLYSVSLKFRLLRQHGYKVSSGIFSTFLDEEGRFSCNELSHEDVKGILSLYEASYLAMEGESILDLARDFATFHLNKRLEDIHITQGDEIRHALELSIHWRVQTLEAKWFINVYQSRIDANQVLLQLAKLNFNIAQARLQDEIKQLSSWYKGTCLSKKLSFARHRIMECFLWALGLLPEPHNCFSRNVLAKLAVVITIMDDIYDVYGTLDELQLLTSTFDRWDVNGLDMLPEYLQLFFLAIFNFVNETAYELLRDRGVNVISNLRKLCAEMSELYYLEAKWYHSGYFPSLNEYLNIAWKSVAGHITLLFTYICTTNPINMKELQYLEQYPKIIQLPSMVLRLADDLATSSNEMKRGDVPKSIQCHMHDTGCSEDAARQHIKLMLDLNLKRMNQHILMATPAHVKNLVPAAMNLGRFVQCLYGHEDGFGSPHAEIKQILISLIVEPIPMMPTITSNNYT